MKRALLLLSLLALGACSEPEPEESRSSDPLDDGRYEVDGAFSDMTGTMDKAKGVEDIAGGRTRQLDEDIEED